jgi:hypothetical protein
VVTFCTTADLEALLQVAITRSDSAERAIEAATAAIQGYCRQQLVYVEDDELTLTASPSRSLLLLPELPVIDVSAVEEDGTGLTVSDDYTWTRDGLLYRFARFWNSGFQKIAVTYSHGHEVIPPMVREVCARSAARGYQAGLRASASQGVPGVQSQQIPDYSVAYTADTSPGSGGLMLGVSAPPLLLPSEREALNPYRVKP